MSVKRLNRELRQIMKNKDLPYVLGPKTEDDLSVWTAKVPGPKGTAYEDTIYEIEITIPMNGYPFIPPVPVFVTPIFHPNIEKGKACLSLVKDWSPEKNMTDVLDELVTLLHTPCWSERIIMEPKDPVEFMKQARRLVQAQK